MITLAFIAGCFLLSGPAITARNLAEAVPAFVPTDPTAVVGYAPMPGVERVFHGAELRQTLKRLGYETALPLADVCFARTVAPLTKDAALGAMRRELGPDAQIEIVELSGFPAPAGELVFPREQLGAPPIALWRGYVSYDSNQKFLVWARVKVSVPSVRAIAAEDLKPGIAIQASQVTLTKVQGFPEKRTTPGSLQEVVGCIPRRYIQAGAPVWKDAIDAPLDITKGDRVTVEVQSGMARLSFDAEAQMSGRRGDLIAFKNPESGKLFRARVEGANKAGIDRPSVKP